MHSKEMPRGYPEPVDGGSIDLPNSINNRKHEKKQLSMNSNYVHEKNNT